MVTLISPYHNGDTQAITSDSSASSSTTTSDTGDMHLGNLVSKLIQIILRTRLGSDSYSCKQDHHSATSHSQCYLTDPLSSNMDTSGWELVLRIIHKRMLLERWIIRFSPPTSPTTRNETNDHYLPSPTSANIILLLQSVYSHTRLLPVEALLNQLLLSKTDLGFLATTTDTVKPSLGCHSSFADGTQPTDFDTVDGFRPLASVATHSFSSVDCIDIEGQLSIQVMYDQTIDKALFTPGPPAQVPSLPPPQTPTPKPKPKSMPFISDDVVVPEYKKKSNVGLSPFYDQQSVPIATTSPNQLQVPLPTSSNSHIGMRRLSRLSLSALNDECCDEENPSSSLSLGHPQRQQYDHMPHPSLVIPLSTSPIQYTHHGHTLAYSTSPSTNYQHKRRFSLPHQQSHHHGLVGSYEESLLSGRMSTLQPSKPIWFHAQIGVLGHGRVKSSLRWPPQRSVVFPAYFYDGQENSNSNSNNNNSGVDETSFFSMTAATTPSIPPYVGTMDLTVDANGAPSKGYRIPSQGQLQITIKSPHNSLVKLFLVPYDVSKMPRGMKTFLRQKSYAQLRQRSQSVSSSPDSQSKPLEQEAAEVSSSTISPPPPPPPPSSSSSSISSTPKYIIHLQICRTEKNRVFLYNKIRVVFVNRYMNPRESLAVVYDGPKEPAYSPLSS